MENIAAENSYVTHTAYIICTVTPSSAPLFKTAPLKKGVHINATGSYSPSIHELPEDIFINTSLYVGIAIQDLITAKYFYDKTCQENLGTSIQM